MVFYIWAEKNDWKQRFEIGNLFVENFLEVILVFQGMDKML